MLRSSSIFYKRRATSFRYCTRHGSPGCHTNASASSFVSLYNVIPPAEAYPKGVVDTESAAVHSMARKSEYLLVLFLPSALVSFLLDTRPHKDVHTLLKKQRAYCAVEETDTSKASRYKPTTCLLRIPSRAWFLSVSRATSRKVHSPLQHDSWDTFPVSFPIFLLSVYQLLCFLFFSYRECNAYGRKTQPVGIKRVHIIFFAYPRWVGSVI